ncbi:dynobactin A family peptide antibiotic [Citrobacter sp. wls619]|uniref:dynobactin A family peptide antibiotic n=1 Tax=Citrobacter sp. wls619 TaxID=2576432 RepID=UPI0026D6AAE8
MDKKIWTKALLASVKAPVTLTGKKIDEKIIVEFTKQPNDASWIIMYTNGVIMMNSNKMLFINL